MCNLNGSVYCIGGTYGQSGNKHCFILNSDHSKWERIASLNTGRFTCDLPCRSSVHSARHSALVADSLLCSQYYNDDIHERDIT